MSESLRLSAKTAFQALGRRLASRFIPQPSDNETVEMHGRNFNLRADTDGDTGFLNTQGLRVQLHGSVDVGEGDDHETAEIHMTNIRD